MIDTLVSFLDSNAFIGLVTFLVGLVALLIYLVSKRELKRDSAKVILLEIKNAERKLKEVKKRLQDGVLPDHLKVMPSNGWINHRHMFINDLESNEWDDVSEFYDYCELLDEIIKRQNSFFWDDVEEIRANKQRLAADYVKEELDRTFEAIRDNKREADADQLIKNTRDLVDAFNRTFEKSLATYKPEQAITDAKKYSEQVTTNVSRSSIGIKLDRIASKKIFLIF